MKTNFPVYWNELPRSIQEALIHNVDSDNLNYDRYESSRVDAIEDILNNPHYNSNNYSAVQTYYEGLNEAEMLLIVTTIRDSLRAELKAVETFLPK